jgi:hypothetical protein
MISTERFSARISRAGKKMIVRVDEDPHRDHFSTGKEQGKMNVLATKVAEKTGMTMEQAEMATSAVLEVLKEEMPTPLAEEIDVLYSGNLENEEEARMVGLFSIP